MHPLERLKKGERQSFCRVCRLYHWPEEVKVECALVPRYLCIRCEKRRHQKEWNLCKRCEDELDGADK